MVPVSPRSPDAYDSLRVLGFVLLGFSGVVMLLAREDPGLAVSVMSIEGLFLLVPLAYVLLFRLPLVSSFAFRLPSLPALFCVGLASASSMWLLNGLTIVQDWVLVRMGHEAYARDTIDQLQKYVVEILALGPVSAFLLLSFLPGLGEEMLFRGVVFRGFQRSIKPVGALLVTAVLFALMHGELMKMIPMFFLGLFFGSLVLMSRSIWAGVLAHMANNGAVLVVAQLESGGRRVSEAPWFVYPFAGALFVLAMTALYRDFRSRENLPVSG